jgi:hypothetical protein
MPERSASPLFFIEMSRFGRDNRVYLRILIWYSTILWICPAVDPSYYPYDVRYSFDKTLRYTCSIKKTPRWVSIEYMEHLLLTYHKVYLFLSIF